MTKDELLEIGLNEEQISKVFKINGLDIEKLKSENEVLRNFENSLKSENENLSKQLKKANDTIEGFKEFDLEEIKKQADDYKSKYEEAVRIAEEDKKRMQMEHSVDNALLKAGAKNPKAVKALLDSEVLEKSSNFNEDLDNQLKGLMETDAYLFEAKETENIQILGGSQGDLNQGISKEEFKDLTYGEMMNLKNSKPEVFEQLSKGD